MTDLASVTQLLHNLPNDKPAASEKIASVVFSELHRLAQGYMGRESNGHTLQATGLVNEAFVNLVEKDIDWQNRAHFYAIAAKQMRRILVDHARKKSTAKRGGEHFHRTLSDTCIIETEQNEEELIIVDDLLNKLSRNDKATGRMFELRYFGGLSNKEIALITNTSIASVEREIRFAKAWIAKQLLSA